MLLKIWKKSSNRFEVKVFLNFQIEKKIGKIKFK